MAGPRMGRNPTRGPLYLTEPQGKNRSLLVISCFAGKPQKMSRSNILLYGGLCLHDRSSLRLDIHTMGMYFLCTHNKKTHPWVSFFNHARVTEYVSTAIMPD